VRIRIGEGIKKMGNLILLIVLLNIVTIGCSSSTSSNSDSQENKAVLEGSCVSGGERWSFGESKIEINYFGKLQNCNFSLDTSKKKISILWEGEKQESKCDYFIENDFLYLGGTIYESDGDFEVYYIMEFFREDMKTPNVGSVVLNDTVLEDDIIVSTACYYSNKELDSLLNFDLRLDRKILYKDTLRYSNFSISPQKLVDKSLNQEINPSMYWYYTNYDESGNELSNIEIEINTLKIQIFEYTPERLKYVFYDLRDRAGDIVFDTLKIDCDLSVQKKFKDELKKK